MFTDTAKFDIDIIAQFVHSNKGFTKISRYEITGKSKLTIAKIKVIENKTPNIGRIIILDIKLIGCKYPK